MPLPLIPDQIDINAWNERAGVDAPTPWQDSLGASVELGMGDTLMGGLGDLYVKNQMSKIEGQRVLSPEELNEKYNDLGIPWTRPEKEHVAESIAAAHRRKNDLHRRIEMSSDGAGQAVMNFVGQMIPLAPEAMLGGLGVRGLMLAKGIGYEYRALQAAKMAKAAGMSDQAAMMASQSVINSAGFAERAGMSFAENALGAVPTELGAKYRDAQFEMDISLTDSLVNIIAGGVLGVGIEGIRSGSRKYRVGDRLRSFKNSVSERMNPTEKAEAVEVAAGQIAEGRKPMLSPLLNVIGQQMDGKGPRPGNAPQAGFVDYGASEQVSGTFYSGTEARMESLGDRSPEAGISDGTNFGPGLSGVSDIFNANAKAVPAGGLVHQFDINGRLAPVDAVIPENLRKGIVDFLRTNDGVKGLENLAKAIEKGEMVSLREVYDNLGADGAEQLSRHLSNEGYQGLHGIEGDAGAERNFVHVFPEHAPEVVAPGPALEHDPRFVKQPSPEEWNDFLTKYHAPENDLFHNAELQEQTAAQVKKAQEVDMDEPEAVAEVQTETVALAKQMKEEGTLSPEGQALLDEFESAKKPKAKDDVDLADSHLSEEEHGSMLAEQRRLQDERNHIYAILDSQANENTRNQALGQLTAVENRMRQIGMNPDNLVVEVADSMPTIRPLTTHTDEGFKFRDDMEPLQVGEARKYKAARTRVGAEFFIKSENDASHSYLRAVDSEGLTIGRVSYSKAGDLWYVDIMHDVKSSWRGSGVGEALYRELNRSTGGLARPDMYGNTSTAAWNSWKKNLPENLIAHVNEIAEKLIKNYGKTASLQRAEIFGNRHVGRDVLAAVQEQLAGRRWRPSFADEVQLRLAPITSDTPIAPPTAMDMKAKVKTGEGVIKGMYNCIGGS